MTTSEQTGTPPPAGWFATTHWSVVLQAQQQDGPLADAALERLCCDYWLPLYVFARRQGQSPADAEDLVQEFFARLLQKDYLQAAAPGRGRFRTFLIVAFKRFLTNEWDRARAQKRGGDQRAVPLDTQLAERGFLADTAPELAADSEYDRQWALALLAKALARLEQEQATAGKAGEFAELRPFLTTPQSGYAAAAKRLGRGETAVRMAVHRLRKRFREVFREEIAQTVCEPADIEAEIHHLLQVLST